MINIATLLYSLLLKHYQKMNQYISYDLTYFMQMWINNQIDAKPDKKFLCRSGYILFARNWNEVHKEDRLSKTQRFGETSRQWNKKNKKEKQKYDEIAFLILQEEVRNFLNQYPYSKWAQKYYDDKESIGEILLRIFLSNPDDIKKILMGL